MRSETGRPEYLGYLLGLSLGLIGLIRILPFVLEVPVKTRTGKASP